MSKDDHVHRTETPDVSHIRNVEVTHERSDVNVGAIGKFVFFLTLLTIVVYVLMWGMFRLFVAQAKKEPMPGPMAMSETQRLPPEPRLQSAKGFGDELGKAIGEKDDPNKPRDPEWEIRVLHQLWEDNLKHGVRDSNGQVVGIPIEEAMKRVASGGLPSRTNGPVKSEDFAIRIPTDASSGRVTEKR